MSGPRRLNLSGAQVMASVLATLTAAVAASFLGVAGTLVGAAVGSMVSTMGTEIYKHYLQRSEERLRSAGQVLYHSAGRTKTGNTGARTGAASGGRHATHPGTAGQQGATQDLGNRGVAGQDPARQETAVWDRRQYGTPRDPHETQVVPGLGTQRASAANANVGSANVGSANGSPANGGSANGSPANVGSANGSPANGGAANGGSSHGWDGPGNSAGEHAHGSITPEGTDGDAGGRGTVWTAITSFFGDLTRRQWLTYGGIAAGFFLVVMAGITVFELGIGKPLSSVVSGGHASGTSFGDTFSGHSSRKATTHPSSTPSATPTGSAPASPTPSGVPSSATPTPSVSVTPSSASSGASATPTAGSGAARSSTTATPTP
ncbi:MAG: hypothetical protein ACRDMI_01300 [Streptosporangiaceae bacterium]